VLLLIHPLESLNLGRVVRESLTVTENSSVRESLTAKESLTAWYSHSNFTQDIFYLSPRDGIIKEIRKTGDTYQVMLLLDDMKEIVYSGLTDILKKEGDSVSANEKIGMDSNITNNTRYIIMVYKNTNNFPQFNNKGDLIFEVEYGSLVYMVASSTVQKVGWDYEEFKGTYLEYQLSKQKISVKYILAGSILNKTGADVGQGQRAMLVTGIGIFTIPSFVLQFQGENWGDDMRVIYLNDKTIEYPY
jgi:hypothetical protein